MRSLVVVAFVLGACGDPPPPVEVSSGRLVARIDSEPAKITLLLDGNVVWETQAGGQAGDRHEPPRGFAAIGSRATKVEMQFGSFKFTETKSSEVWRAIDELADVKATETGATFTLIHDGSSVGTGTLEFVTATKSGPNPDAAGFPRHVSITLESDADRIQIATPCPADEHLVGLGGQSFDIDHRGETVPLFVQEDGIGKDDLLDTDYSGAWLLSGRKHSTHTPMPMVLSSNGYALAVETNGRAVFALGPEEHANVSRFEAWDEALHLHVFIGEGDRGGEVAGAAAVDALGHMIAWVGKPARPPLSIFAPWIDAIYGSANVRRVAQKLRSLGIPASAIWTEDWRGGADSFTGYSLEEDWRYDTALYPDIAQLATELHDLGFAFLTYHNTFVDENADIHDEAIGAGYVMHTMEGEPYSFTGVKFTPSKLLDLTNPAAVTWAKDVMSEGLPLGVDGWMADFAEWAMTDAKLASGEDALAVHNRYPVDWVKMTSEILAPKPGRIVPMYFVRSAWIGSQPYTQVIWPGDQQTDFSDGDGLPSVIPMALNLGLAGFPYFGSDIAGYMSQKTAVTPDTEPTTQELFYRWTSFGAMQPVMRTHHGRSARENYQWEADTGAEQHFRRWARFHMQLAAYFWGSAGSFERDGLPLMRMIALEYPDEAWAWTKIDEYLLGDRILVAPVQVAGATSREVTLPAGRWYPMFGGAPVMGGTITATASTAEIPAYVPEGALVVLFPDGVDSTLPAPGQPSLTTIDEIGGDREVWLFSGTAAKSDHATWNDDDGPAGAAQWTWSGRASGSAPPTTATFEGTPVTVTTANGVSTVTVVGDGTLSFDTGGSLVIARGIADASVTVRLR
ncbi:MAG: TIM-barrel domain-containing protein [Kofleriaceae bacterium]